MTDKPCPKCGKIDRTDDGRCRPCRNTYFRAYRPKWVAKRKKQRKLKTKEGKKP